MMKKYNVKAKKFLQQVWSQHKASTSGFGHNDVFGLARRGKLWFQEDNHKKSVC